jgi:hypothetical protein
LRGKIFTFLRFANIIRKADFSLVTLAKDPHLVFCFVTSANHSFKTSYRKVVLCEFSCRFFLVLKSRLHVCIRDNITKSIFHTKGWFNCTRIWILIIKFCKNDNDRLWFWSFIGPDQGSLSFYNKFYTTFIIVSCSINTLTSVVFIV